MISELQIIVKSLLVVQYRCDVIGHLSNLPKNDDVIITYCLMLILATVSLRAELSIFTASDFC